MAYVGFDKLARKVGSPALAAYIGRKKYGAKSFDEHAAAGRKMRGVRPKAAKKVRRKAY